jgi:multidrug efflux pump subunit AcrB
MSTISSKAQAYLDDIKHSFFWRWIVNYKVSFLLITLVILYGLFIAIKIPKESSPDIKFGIVQISTVYPGANPVDIDDIITSKIEEKVKDLDGIDTMNSSSSLWISNITVTLDNGIDVKDFITDVRNKIDSISFPDDVKDSNVIEVSTANEILFQMILYGPRKDFSMDHLRTLAMKFKDDVKDKWGIVDVGIAGVVGDSDFDMQVQLDQTKLESYGLTVWQVLTQIRAYNQNLPLGNYALGDLRYDYRIDNEITSLSDLQNIPITLWSSYIRLNELAKIVRSYKNKTISYGWIYNSANNHAIELTIYKKNRSNVFQDSTTARTVIDETLQKLPFSWLNVAYTVDLADVIVDDYSSLARNGITSVILVFLITALFIGLRQSLIATIAMPISFFITFMVLDYLGMTMNFMVNFSLILSFGMGIDTVIVFIESARENMKKWYNPTSAILITMHMYARPNIITSLINIVVFVPMLVLPGIVGKFVSYIPITLFSTLLASLLLALTVNGALFAKLNKKLDYYYNDDEHDESLAIMNDEEKEILYIEREGKKSIPLDDAPWLERIIDRMRDRYVTILQFVVAHSFWRKVVILLPVGLVIGSLVLLGPSIGFKLFPSGDNPNINFQITAREWTDIKSMAKIVSGVDVLISQLPEIKSYSLSVQNTAVDLWVSLVKKEERTRDSFEIQAEIESGLSYLKTAWYKFEGKVQAGWPPVGKAVGIKLIASDKKLLSQLKQVSKDFEDYLSSLTGTINVTNSSTQSPGQFSFTFDQERLAELWLTPSDVQSEIYSAINGIKAGTMTVDTKERDIVVKMNTFADEVSPEMLYNLILTTKSGQIRLSDIASVSTDPALTSIKRVDQDIVISIEADLEQWLQPTNFQPQLESFAKNYKYPTGISYKSGWENEANADLIQSAMMAFVVALFLTFVLLVYQFNSYAKPAIVLYSIFTALLWVNIGLWVTGNPYSMAFAIGFISLIGVIVNTAIFLVDRINENQKKWVWLIESILEAGQARFKPIIISTLTTILGLWSVVTQDEFYAGLWYTVIFGLLFSSVITLIAVPILYYSVFRERNEEDTWRSRLRRIGNKISIIWNIKNLLNK